MVPVFPSGIMVDIGFWRFIYHIRNNIWAHQEEKFLQMKNDKPCMVNYETALLTWISHHKDEDVKLLQIIA